MNDNETCCAICGDEIVGEGVDNGYTIVCSKQAIAICLMAYGKVVGIDVIEVTKK